MLVCIAKLKYISKEETDNIKIRYIKLIKHVNNSKNQTIAILTKSYFLHFVGLNFFLFFSDSLSHNCSSDLI